MIKIGKIQLMDWECPIIQGSQWITPYRFSLGTQFDGNHYVDWSERTMVFINCGAPGDFWVEFWGDLRFLDKIYLVQRYSSYEDAKEKVDKFLGQMDRLMAFT
jgi:hypothetical protein